MVTISTAYCNRNFTSCHIMHSWISYDSYSTYALLLQISLTVIVMKTGCIFCKVELSIITLSRLIPVSKERECVNFITKK